MDTSGSGPDLFLDHFVRGARFDGEADFSGRSFEQTADFTGARFYYPPNFDGATNVARIDFTGAHIGFARPGQLLIGLPTPKSHFACALFEKSRKKPKTTISNATSISRNAKPSAASICGNGSKT